MKTAQHRTFVRTIHTFEMDGPITARDLGDFVVQVNGGYELVTGHLPLHDDSYRVEPTDTGLKAVFATDEESPRAKEFANFFLTLAACKADTTDHLHALLHVAGTGASPDQINRAAQNLAKEVF